MDTIDRECPLDLVGVGADCIGDCSICPYNKGKCKGDYKMSVRQDLWDSSVRHYWDAVRKCKPHYTIKFTENGEKYEEDFDTWADAKKFAKKMKANRVTIGQFEYANCRNAEYPYDYDGYDKVVVDLDKKIIDWGRN